VETFCSSWSGCDAASVWWTPLGLGAGVTLVRERARYADAARARRHTPQIRRYTDCRRRARCGPGDTNVRRFCYSDIFVHTPRLDVPPSVLRRERDVVEQVRRVEATSSNSGRPRERNGASRRSGSEWSELKRGAVRLRPPRQDRSGYGGWPSARDARPRSGGAERQECRETFESTHFCRLATRGQHDTRTAAPTRFLQRDPRFACEKPARERRLLTQTATGPDAANAPAGSTIDFPRRTPR
jgi:hypothetical protein